MDPKVCKQNLGSFYYFSKKALPIFIIFGPCLFHKILQSVQFLSFPWNLSNPRGFSEKNAFFFQ
jgi:hypothetical protein